MSTFLGDLAYAFRQFRHSPVFALTAILTLALGIGGTTAIFSLMHEIMLRSLPVANSASLYRVGSGNDCCVEGGPQDNWGMYTFPLYERIKAATPEFEEITAFQANTERYSVVRASVDRTAKPLRGEFASGQYFSVFGVRPYIGRFFTPADDKASASPVIVISHHAWQDAWGANPGVLGAQAIIRGQTFSIIGVAPPGFFGETLRSNPPDFWIPLQQEPLIRGEESLLRQPVSAWLRVIGRLKPNATTAGMSERLTGLLKNWLLHESGYPPEWMTEVRRMLPKQTIHVIPAGNGVEEMKEDYGRSLNILLTVCGMVLLIVCANVANLLIARGMARSTQTSIRLALGASRSRIVSQSLAESIVLAVGGGIIGIFVAFAAEKLIISLAFHEGNQLPFNATPSIPALAFAMGLSIVTGLIFGAAPAWLATRRAPVEALRGANRTTRGDHASISRRILLVVQAALSVALVAGATMLTRSLANLEHQNFGFDPNHLYMASISSPPASYTVDRLNSLYREVHAKVRQVPGIENSSLCMYAPLTDNWGEIIFVDGHPPAELSEKYNSSWDRVSAGHFATVKQDLVKGRVFTDSDSETSENVAVVNEAFVRRFFPNEEPLDKHFGIDMSENARAFRIVGVVRDAKYSQASRPARPMFFLPMPQQFHYREPLLQKLETRSHGMDALMVRSHMSPEALEPILRKIFSETDPNLSLVSVRGMNDQISRVFDQERAVARLAGLFGVIALLLAAVGLYGITAYTVVQRTNEIGLRVALGADSGSVLRLVLKGAFRMVGVGLLIGIPLAVGGGKWMSAQLYNVQGWDPIALSLSVVALGICAFIASIIPAMRAAAIDPMTALRIE